jgi:GntR family transcriptional regulator/MocR family aminotransferase
MNKLSIPLYQRLYEDIKEKILNNEYKKNSRLESIRSLSNRLNISTTTVEKAYNQLLVEGYIKSKPRSGYTVMDVQGNEKRRYKNVIEPLQFTPYENNKLTNDLFDIKTYKSILNKVINYQSEQLYTECNPAGEVELREEIRKYILKERDVKTDINQIIIGPGIQNLLQILLGLVKGKSVTYLNPEFSKAINIFKDHDYTLKPRDSIEEVTRLKTDFLYISPSNMYPTGEVLKAQKRNRIIKWAMDNSTYIIEDDYNFLMRYNSYTIPSIHSYDNGENVIYIGSFSKTLLPSIRISYMVLPMKLYEVYKANYYNYAQGVSKLEQLAVGLYMKEGLYQRHTKKLYNLYKEKNEIVLKELEKYQKNHDFKIRGSESNLHIVFDFKNKSQKKAFIRNCERYYYKYEAINNQNSVIFPYSGIENKRIKKIFKDLLYNI